MQKTATTLSEIRQLMAQYKFYPQKKWGQNFLCDQNIANKIIAACDPGKKDYVIEIGPGLGALTVKLAEICRGVLAIEIDRGLQEVYQQTLAVSSNICLLFDDVLKVSLEEELTRSFNLTKTPSYKVCANIPYNITTPIIFHLLENESQNMKSATLMMQKEVAERVMAVPGGKDYGLLTIMTHYYADVEWVMKVSRNCFYPRPEVDSAVLRFIPLPGKRVQLKNEAEFKGLLRRAFQKRRKTVLNICTDYFQIPKTEVFDKLKSIEISPQNRPEDLTIEQFAKLVDIFVKQEAQDDIS